MMETTTGAIEALAIYTGLNALILLWLAFQTGRVRRSVNILMGDGGNPRMIRIMRGHANAMEFIPVTLIALLVVALVGGSAWTIHGLGLLLTVGRFLHALHFTAADAPAWQRAAGAGLSILAMAGAALWALFMGLTALV